VVLRQRRYGLSAPTAVELLGPGDVVRPWDPEPEEETLSVTGSWQVGASTAMAVIDSRILVVAAHRPQLVASLFARGVSRSRRLLLNGALRGIPGAGQACSLSSASSRRAGAGSRRRASWSACRSATARWRS